MNPTVASVDLEVLPDGCILARIGGANWQFGEPYEIMVVVAPLDEDTCEIRGLDKAPTIGQWRGLEMALAGKGYKFLEFDRLAEGTCRRHRRSLRAA